MAKILAAAEASGEVLDFVWASVSFCALLFLRLRTFWVRGRGHQDLRHMDLRLGQVEAGLIGVVEVVTSASVMVILEVISLLISLLTVSSRRIWALAGRRCVICARPPASRIPPWCRGPSSW